MSDVSDGRTGKAVLAQRFGDAPSPWQVGDAGVILDANGRPIAYLANRLHCPSGLDQDAESWRPLANKLAAAPELETKFAELLDWCEEALTRLGAATMLQAPVLEAARAALAKARAPAA